MDTIAERISDPRIKLLSYSSLLKLHACPRSYQLYKLNATVEAEEDAEASLTYAYGHAVGTGIQLCFQGFSYEDTCFYLFCSWSVDLLAEDTKRKKSFFLALAAIKQFYFLRSNGYLSDWELVEYNGESAVELSFAVSLPNDYCYRGSVDVVLRNKITSQVMVIECKTSSSQTLNPVEYKNSAQAIGYSIVLDHLFSDLSSYQVLYLVYLTKTLTWEPITFSKHYVQRALWIRELLLDCELITMYSNADVFPMHGENCINRYYRECEYLNVCTLSTEYITKKLSDSDMKVLEEREATFSIKVDIQDLISAQLAK